MPLARHTLGHALILQRIGSPLAGRPGMPRPVVGVGDIAQAMQVCSGPWERTHARLDTFREWLWMHWAALMIRRQGPQQAAADIWAYLADAWPTIRWWNPEGSRPRSLGAELLHILLMRQREFGLSLRAALSVPLAVAHWDAAAVAEREGGVTIRRASDDRLLTEYDHLIAAGALPLPGTIVNRRN